MRLLHFAILISAAPLFGIGCGGTVDDTGNQGGSAGSAGAAGSGGEAGSAGAAGSAGSAGMAGAGGTTMTTTTTTTTTSGPDIGQPSDVYPAPHAAPPKVITYGGPVLAAPKVQPIFFSNDDPAIVAKTTDFVGKAGTADHWKQTTSEYGVGPLSALPAVNLPETATGTTNDSAIQSFLAGKLNSNDPAFAPPDDDTVYALIYPKGLTINESGAQSCYDFGGYHSNLQLDAAHGNRDVAYIVLPRCTSFGGLFGIDVVTGALSHELIEAATDPYPMSNPAYAQTDNAHLYWLFALGGGETGDMCAQDPEAFMSFPDVGYTVQRSWSNKSAAEGHDPCVPQPAGDVYFNAAPALNDTIVFSAGGGFTVNVKGVKIADGASKTIDVDLFSDAPTDGPIQVEALDYSQLVGGPQRLSFDWDADQGLNGQTLHLTITVDSASKNKSELFFLASTVGNQRNLWVGVVGQ